MSNCALGEPMYVAIYESDYTTEPLPIAVDADESTARDEGIARMLQVAASCGDFTGIVSMGTLADTDQAARLKRTLDEFFAG